MPPCLFRSVNEPFFHVVNIYLFPHSEFASLLITPQRWLGHRPLVFILAFMFLGICMSALLTNVAAPVLLIPMVQSMTTSNALVSEAFIALFIIGVTCSS